MFRCAVVIDGKKIDNLNLKTDQDLQQTPESSHVPGVVMEVGCPQPGPRQRQIINLTNLACKNAFIWGCRAEEGRVPLRGAISVTFFCNCEETRN